MSDVISVAVIDSRAAFRAADVVIDYVRRLGASLRVLTVREPAVPPPEAYIADKLLLRAGRAAVELSGDEDVG